MENVSYKTIEVDGESYLVNHPQVEEAFEIGMELLKLIGGSAASMASAVGDEDKVGEALGIAVSSLLNKIQPKESMRLVKRILASVEAQSPKKMLLNDSGIKIQFHGRTGSMLRLVGEVLEFTHKDFFEAIGDGVAGMMKKVAEKAAA